MKEFSNISIPKLTLNENKVEMHDFSELKDGPVIFNFLPSGVVIYITTPTQKKEGSFIYQTTMENSVITDSVIVDKLKERNKKEIDFIRHEDLYIEDI